MASPEASHGPSTPDGSPHAVGVGALRSDGVLQVASSPGTRTSRELAATPACTISARCERFAVVFEGEAGRVTEEATLEQVAALYRQGWWPDVSVWSYALVTCRSTLNWIEAAT